MGVLTGVLMIFLHLAPMVAGMGYSIYQNKGIHVVWPAPAAIRKQPTSPTSRGVVGKRYRRQIVLDAVPQSNYKVPRPVVSSRPNRTKLEDAVSIPPRGGVPLFRSYHDRTQTVA
jgi:hypothetical protein